MHTTCLRFSQCTTSFIGTRRQGILRAPLVPAPHHSRRRILVRRYFSRVVGAALPLLSRTDTPPGVLAARLALSCSIWIVNLPPAPASVRRASQLLLPRTATSVAPPGMTTCSSRPVKLRLPTKQPRSKPGLRKSLRGFRILDYVVRVTKIASHSSKSDRIIALIVPAVKPIAGQGRVEMRGLEPLTYALQRRRSPN